MLRALLDDLMMIPGLEILSTHDCRVSPMCDSITFHPVARRDAFWPLWRRLCSNVDAVWPVAPESDGLLERVSRLALDNGAGLLGSRPEALRVAASKRDSFRCLHAAGIGTIETRFIDEDWPAGPHGWVVKPDDGAGCEDTWYLDSATLPTKLPLDGQARYVVQPFEPGEALSLSLLCASDGVSVLSVNRQAVRRDGPSLRYGGVKAGVSRADRRGLESVAQGLWRALPGLWGYVGVDLVVGAAGPLVVDINPRLTGAYVGLRGHLGVNPAAAVLDLWARESEPSREAIHAR